MFGIIFSNIKRTLLGPFFVITMMERNEELE